MSLRKDELDDLAQQAADAYAQNGCSSRSAAKALGWPRSTFRHRLKRAGELGLCGTAPVIPGFRISKITKGPNGESIEQRPEHGAEFEMPPGQKIKGESALVGADGRLINKWIKTTVDAEQEAAAMQAVVDGFSEKIPRVRPISLKRTDTREDLLNQFTVTDLHLGALAWHEESGADYDLKIAEELLLDWFWSAIKLSPNAAQAIFAQLGDLLHYDSLMAVTPTSGHVLDSDSRFQKIVRVVIRVLRQIMRMLLEMHDRVHVIMADANHDPASGAWLREMFAAFYDNESRVTVDNSASTYYVFEHGETSLFYHHGHKRGIGNVDSVFAGQFRNIYGRTKYSYAHLGHLHNDELKSTNLMKVERHETLAARDAFAANGGWLSDRSAKVITYSKEYGEVGRLTLSPHMVANLKDAA